MPGRRAAPWLTRTEVTGGIASGQDGTGYMIGYQWTVYHRHNSGESACILAVGLAGKPDEATSAVDMILDEADRAAWGLMLGIAMDPWSFGPAGRVPQWPHRAGMWVGWHASDGCFHWWPLHPCQWAGEDTRVAADPAGESR